MNRAVFLDRDGVLTKTILINGKSFAPRTLKKFKLFSGSSRLIKNLKSAGFKVFVVTNQPDVGKKLMSKFILKKMHAELKRKIKIDAIYSCTHTREQNCSCRKPKPGMILSLAKKYKIDLTKSFMVGDRASDIEAGNKANCRTIFINRKYKEKKPISQEATFLNLNGAVGYILKQKEENA